MQAIVGKANLLWAGLFSVLLIASPLASAQQKPSLKQLEQQARDRLEADRRRRQDLEAQAREQQRREAAAAAESEKRRLAVEADAKNRKAELLPIVKGDSLVCGNGGFRRNLAEFLAGGGRLGQNGSWDTSGYMYAWQFLIEEAVLRISPNSDPILDFSEGADGWLRWATRPPVYAFVFRNENGIPRGVAAVTGERFPNADPIVKMSEQELRNIADMTTTEFLSPPRFNGAREPTLLNDYLVEAGVERTSAKALALYYSANPLNGGSEKLFALIDTVGSKHSLHIMSRKKILLSDKNGRVIAQWDERGGLEGVNNNPNRRGHFCVNGHLQERVLINLYTTTVDQFGGETTTSPYAVLLVTDIPFTNQSEVSDSAERQAGGKSTKEEKEGNLFARELFSPVVIVTVDAIGNAISDLRMVDTEGSGKVRKIMLTKGRYRLRPVTIESSGRDSAVVFCRCNFKQGAPPYFWIYDYATSEKGRSRVGVQVPENRQFSAAEAFSKAPIDSFELKSDGWIKLFIYDDVIQDNAGAVSVAIERLSPN